LLFGTLVGACGFDTTPENFRYRDISFTHPAGWQTDIEELDLGYYIGCKKSYAIMTAIVVGSDSTPEECVGRCLSNLFKSDDVKSFSHGNHI
jgi:hypothetical protein